MFLLQNRTRAKNISEKKLPTNESHLDRPAEQGSEKPADSAPITSQEDNAMRLKAEKKQALSAFRLTKGDQKPFSVTMDDGAEVKDKRPIKSVTTSSDFSLSSIKTGALADGLFVAHDHELNTRQIAQMPWDPKFTSESDAALLELFRINGKVDHAIVGVEYNAMVGHSRFGVEHSNVHKSRVDDPKASNEANYGAINDLHGALPDVMIHSHPVQEGTTADGKHEVRPWWFFSPSDVLAQQEVSRDYGTNVQGYVLGPNGEVLTWKKGDDTFTAPNGEEWGKPTMIGKFDKEGNFIPLKNPATFDHMHPPEAEAYDQSHKITASTFQQWESGRYPKHPGTA
jgi:hypothetical protein